MPTSRDGEKASARSEPRVAEGGRERHCGVLRTATQRLPAAPKRRHQWASARGFFYHNCSLDRPRVDIEMKLLRDLSCQPPRSNGAARCQLFLDKRHCCALKFVRAAWTSLPWHQAGDPRFLEACFGLVVCRPRYPVFLRRADHGSLLGGYAAQHLVFDLHDVVRVEELAAAEFRIADLLRCRVQCTLFEKRLHLRILSAVLLGHHELPKSTFH